MTEQVFLDDDGWYFWDETWTDKVGPFDSEAEARGEMHGYALTYLGMEFKHVHAHCVAWNLRPRVHGNGFVQLDLSPRVRMNVWGHPDIPRQRVATPIHDHAFGFRSFCIRGRMVNVRYQDVSGTEFHVHEPRVRSGEDTVLEPTGRHCSIIAVGTDVLVPYPGDNGVMNRHYDMRAGELHETHTPEPTVTVMRKHAIQRSEVPPRVLVPAGKQPDNDFCRHEMAGDDRLWRIIKECMA